MDQCYYNALAHIRIDRAKELLTEAEALLMQGCFKSANNRAYYAIEKCIKALLSLKQTDVATHNGAMKQFNFLFIYQGDGTFTSNDYQKIARAEQIRNASDYDDFYIASKEETKQQVENAKYIVEKVTNYMNAIEDNILGEV